ncbi:MAG TPA: 50S ribosomal protein L4 [Firmicutes bacterium]|nr:50S ribosomal protein L4 [Bacillota bacterium]
MPKSVVYNTEGQQVSEIELSDAVFGVEPNTHVLHEAVVMQRASERLGTAKTKTIGEVRGGGIKPWRQKGTGRARHGSRRSPLWPGGATLFGPVPRDYGYELPRKVRRLALRSALSAKAGAGELVIVEDLRMKAPKTREMKEILDRLGIRGKALIVMDQVDENVELSARNIPGVKTIPVEKLNVYDILASDKVLMTRNAARGIEEVLAG